MGWVGVSPPLPFSSSPGWAFQFFLSFSKKPAAAAASFLRPPSLPPPGYKQSLSPPLKRREGSNSVGERERRDRSKASPPPPFVRRVGMEGYGGRRGEGGKGHARKRETFCGSAFHSSSSLSLAFHGIVCRLRGGGGIALPGLGNERTDGRPAAEKERERKVGSFPFPPSPLRSGTLLRGRGRQGIYPEVVPQGEEEEDREEAFFLVSSPLSTCPPCLDGLRRRRRRRRRGIRGEREEEMREREELSNGGGAEGMGEKKGKGGGRGRRTPPHTQDKQSASGKEGGGQKRSPSVRPSLRRPTHHTTKAAVGTASYGLLMA